MAYTVKEVSRMSGVSVRTLHYYDEIGLLKPVFYGENGYRYYEQEQLLQLRKRTSARLSRGSTRFTNSSSPCFGRARASRAPRFNASFAIITNG